MIVMKGNEMTTDSMVSAAVMLEDMTRRELTDVICVLLGRLSYLKDCSPATLIIEARQRVAMTGLDA